jgi:hypothetical protein
MSTRPPSGAFGPWIADVEPGEERAQLRLVGGIAAAFIGSWHPLVATIRRAEDDACAKADTLRMLNVLPSLTRRRIVSVFGGVMWAKGQANRRPASKRRRGAEPNEPVARFSDLPRSDRRKPQCEIA